MTCGFIYKIQFPNEKHYIGLTTTSLKQRQTQHKLTSIFISFNHYNSTHVYTITITT